MTDVELRAFSLTVVVQLVDAKNKGEMAFPVMVTLTDAAGTLVDFGKLRFPIAMEITDQNGERYTIDITQSFINKVIEQTSCEGLQ